MCDVVRRQSAMYTPLIHWKNGMRVCKHTSKPKAVPNATSLTKTTAWMTNRQFSNRDKHCINVCINVVGNSSCWYAEIETKSSSQHWVSSISTPNLFLIEIYAKIVFYILNFSLAIERWPVSIESNLMRFGNLAACFFLAHR